MYQLFINTTTGTVLPYRMVPRVSSKYQPPGTKDLPGAAVGTETSILPGRGMFRPYESNPKMTFTRV